MSTWLLWIILSSVTGSPIGAAIALIVIGLVTDRFALGLMPVGFDLALGRARLKRKDYKGARAAFERAIQVRRGTVEGRVLLAQSLTGLGDEPAAALMRDQAWSEYVSAPTFQRRKERLWAWRARPSRPATWAIALAMVLILFGRLAGPAISGWAARNNTADQGYGPPPPRAPLPDE